MKNKFGPEKKKGEDCRICNGPCHGIEYHAAIRASWAQEEPVTAYNFTKYRSKKLKKK